MDKILIGSHVSMSGPNYFLGSVKEAISYNANTLMFYTGAPQNSKRTPLNNCKIEEGLKLAKDNNLEIDKFVCHAPYIINLGNPDLSKFEISKNVLLNEINRCHAFHCKYLVLHPGLHVNNGIEVGLNSIVKGLNDVLNELEINDVIICLETMAGKGSELGTTFEEIKYIIDNVKRNELLGVCLDTCHINDAGYDVSDIDKIINDFDNIVGLSRLKVIHLNDSKNIKGAHKDRHENIGFGTIGFNNLIKYVYDERLKDIPKILETPYIEENAPYKKEIDMIKNRSFNPLLKEEVMKKGID